MFADFPGAAQRIPGLEYLGDEEAEFEPDTDFAVRDTRRGRDGQVRDDKPVVGRLYLGMPGARALQELLRLSDRYQAGTAIATSRRCNARSTCGPPPMPPEVASPNGRRRTVC